MRIDETTPWWGHNFILCGNEGEGDGGGSGDGGDAGGDSSGDGGSSDAGGEGEGSGDGDAGDEGLPDDKDIAGLKSALQKERQNVKALKAEKTRLQQAESELQAIKDKDKTESERASAAQKKAEAKVERLATGYKTSAIDTAIERLAREFKFRDPGDAILMVDRSAIEVTQDDDDPSDVKVDGKTLKAAVKALAEKKKHLIGEEGSDEPSGSRFGGGNKSKKELSEEEMKKKYPSLA